MHEPPDLLRGVASVAARVRALTGLRVHPSTVSRWCQGLADGRRLHAQRVGWILVVKETDLLAFLHLENHER